jgi:hypothetical protein
LRPALRPPQALCEALAGGGDFGADSILQSSGGLFADAEVIPLTPREIAQLVRVDEPDWSNVEPSKFGTFVSSATRSPAQNKARTLRGERL